MLFRDRSLQDDSLMKTEGDYRSSKTILIACYKQATTRLSKDTAVPCNRTIPRKDTDLGENRKPKQFCSAPCKKSMGILAFFIAENKLSLFLNACTEKADAGGLFAWFSQTKAFFGYQNASSQRYSRAHLESDDGSLGLRAIFPLFPH